jgi:S-adenosyl methyltransferase
VVDEWAEHASRRRKAAQIDTTVPNAARAWNYLVGGRDNFLADRKAARELLVVAPAMSATAIAARAFHRRVVGYLAAEAGLRQFLDIGAGMPAAGGTHEVAQSVAARSRIVYADNDPVVIAHARALLASAPEGMTSCLEVDARDTAQVLAGAAACLDLAEPVAVILMGILAYVDLHEDALRMAGDLMAALPAGSYIAIRHAASDLDPSMPAAARLWNKMSPQARLTPRSRDEVASFTRGLGLVDPGLVPVDQWRPEPASGPAAGEGPVVPVYGAVARKPLPARRPCRRGVDSAGALRGAVLVPAGHVRALRHVRGADLLAAVTTGHDRVQVVPA